MVCGTSKGGVRKMKKKKNPSLEHCYCDHVKQTEKQTQTSNIYQPTVCKVSNLNKFNRKTSAKTNRHHSNSEFESTHLNLSQLPLMEEPLSKVGQITSTNTAV